MGSMRPSRCIIRCALALLALTALAAEAVQPEGQSTAARFEIDPTGSEVGFLMQTTWHMVEGRTRAMTGTVSSASGDLFMDGQATFEIEAATLETGNSRRDRTMRDDCLETTTYPKITFASSGPPTVLSRVGVVDNPSEVSFTVPGDLTIHGVKRSVVLPVNARHEGAVWIESEPPHGSTFICRFVGPDS